MNELEKERVKQYLPLYAQEVLKKSKSGLYICPFCNSGTGEHETGAFSIKDNMFHCFACNESGDIYSLYAKVNNLDSKKDFVKISNELNEKYGNKPIIAKADKPKEAKDFTKFYEQAFLRRTSIIDYLTNKRKIGAELIEKYKIGYDNGRVIIPCTASYYFSRNIESKSFYNEKNSAVCLWNENNLKDSNEDTYIFICESITDCLSLETIDNKIKTIALNGVGNISLLVSKAEEYNYKGFFVSCCDNDTPGITASKKLKESRFRTLVVNDNEKCYQGSKDINELLQANKIETIQGIIAKAEEYKQTELNEYLQALEDNERYFDTFAEHIKQSLYYKPIKTNFSQLDTLLGGGIRKGLYCLGAVSSLGKTALMVQLAENFAQQKDVFYFSLEMPRDELIARGISRQALEIDTNRNGTTSIGKPTIAKPYIDILSGYKYPNFTQEEKELINEAYEEYKRKYARNYYIFESIGDLRIDDIVKKVKTHKAKTGTAPIIIVDYLQLLQAEDDRKTDKQNMDTAVLKLKQLSRDLEAIVFVISSFNRSNYTQEANESAFKESGAIEYTADCLLALQYKDIEYQMNGNKWETEAEHSHRVADIRKEQNKRAYEGLPQNLELVILKNRNGSKGKVYLDYYPKYNSFVEEWGSLRNE